MTGSTAEITELDSPPSLARLYAQAVLSPIVPGGDEELPGRKVVLPGVEVEADRVADYCRVCCFSIRNVAPGTYPHILAFPLHLCLMTDRSFPFSVLGLVHIANRIDVLAPIPIGASLDLSVRAEDLRPHRRGRQFDLVAEATLDGEIAWRGRSTYLSRGGEGNGADSESSERSNAEEEGLNVAAQWRIPGDIGRRYAAVSGDRNPIHMHALSARLFGFPTAIAHGMWTKARCLAAFEGRTRDELTVDVEFRAPLRIPGRVRFLSGRRDDAWRFRVEAPDGERSHLIGSVV
jgi:acyl dehydratase